MKKYNIISKLLYLIAILNFIFFIVLSIANIINIKEYLLIVATLISCSLIYIGGNILFNKIGNKEILKINIYIYFVFYLGLLFFFIFINPFFGRSSISFNNNLIPFNSIKMYLNQFNSIYESKILLNLIGNFICIMPFSFFAKYFFKNKYIIFSILLFVIGIEFIQYFTGCGSFDIDDIILNSSGAIIMYFILNIKAIDNIIQSIFFKTKKISRKEVIYLILVILLLLFSFVAVIIYRKNLYDKNLNDYNNIKNPDIRFVYDDKCSENNLFYEDEIYEYYFECFNSNNFHIIVNGKEETNITTLIDDSKYEVDIERIITMMEFQQIKYYIKHKYQFFDLEIEKKSDTLSTATFFKNDYVKLVLKEKENTSSDLLFYEVNIIPLKNGTSTVKISFDFNVGNVVESVNKYIQIDIDDNLMVTYRVIE